MRYETKEYKSIDEKVFVYEHTSGLKAFVIPKKGYSKKYATFSTHYGSVNNVFELPENKEIVRVPDGIAHFLEHKLFEQKEGSVMDKFAALGANPNAYTSFNQTVYLFSCTERFDENFRLLLDFVQNPYITEESVEKEKGIIGQEINMYLDNADWRVFFNLLGAFYVNNPIKIDIAGTVESISKINREVLYQCYNTFYHPSNMAICVVGDVNEEEVFKLVEEVLKPVAQLPEIKRVFPEEPAKINQAYVEQILSVSAPIFQMGFKDTDFLASGTDCLRREVAVKLLLELILGRSSLLYKTLYEEGLLNASFDFDYTIEESYAFSMFGGESPKPETVRDRIMSAIETAKKESLDEKSFMRIKKAMRGRYLRAFNSVERISRMFIPVYFKKASMFDYMDIYDKITFEYVNEVFDQHFKRENMALSVIKPG